MISPNSTIQICGILTWSSHQVLESNQFETRFITNLELPDLAIWRVEVSSRDIPVSTSSVLGSGACAKICLFTWALGI